MTSSTVDWAWTVPTTVSNAPATAARHSRDRGDQADMGNINAVMGIQFTARARHERESLLLPMRTILVNIFVTSLSTRTFAHVQVLAAHYCRPAYFRFGSSCRARPGKGPQPLFLAPLRDRRGPVCQRHQADWHQDQPHRGRRGSADRAHPR